MFAFRGTTRIGRYTARSLTETALDGDLRPLCVISIRCIGRTRPRLLSRLTAFQADAQGCSSLHRIYRISSVGGSLRDSGLEVLIPSWPCRDYNGGGGHCQA